MRIWLPWCMLLAPAACETPVAVVDHPPVRHAAHAWSGGSLRLTSDAFAWDGAIAVYLDGQALAWTREDDTTIVAPLPEANGTLPLRVTHDGALDFAGQVTLHGLVSVRALPDLGPVPFSWPRGLGTVAGVVGTHLMLIHPATGTSTQLLPDSLVGDYCGSPRDGAMGSLVTTGRTSAGSCTYTRELVGGPLWTVADSAPSFATATWHGGGVRLASGWWLQWSANYMALRAPAAAGGQQHWLDSISEAQGVILAPDGRYAVPLGGTYYGSGIPLFRAAAPLSPLFLPSQPYLGQVRSAVFTASGDTLYLQPTAADSLFHVDPWGGRIRQAVVAPSAFDALALDDGGPWLFAFAVPGSTSAGTLTVYDRRNLDIVAVQQVEGAPADLPYDEVLLATDGSGRRLHAVAMKSYQGTHVATVAYTFSLVP